MWRCKIENKNWEAQQIISTRQGHMSPWDGGQREPETQDDRSKRSPKFAPAEGDHVPSRRNLRLQKLASGSKPFFLGNNRSKTTNTKEGLISPWYTYTDRVFRLLARGGEGIGPDSYHVSIKSRSKIKRRIENEDKHKIKNAKQEQEMVSPGHRD